MIRMTANNILSNSTVMIIDDTPENLALLSDTLSESGYRVLVATDGTSALEQIGFLKPDIILLDVLMPGINGFETCKRLKNDASTSTIPVIFMTALSELDDLLRGFEEGAVDYLVKPIRPPEVLARVEAQLNQSRRIKRAEIALQNSSYSVLAVTDNGYITWLPESGRQGLAECMQGFETVNSYSVGSQLPPPLYSQFLAQLEATENNGSAVHEVTQGNLSFSFRIMQCQHTKEYLLLLDKRKDAWDLDDVRSSLGLTLREAEILMWISRGKTNKEMGVILGTSPRTVNKHLEHIFEKLGVITRAAAVSVVMNRANQINTPTESV